MPLVSNGNGLYTATVATDVSGGQWDTPANPDMDSHLQSLILNTFAYAAANGANPLQNVATPDGGVSVIVQFDHDISAGDMTTLAGLVARASEYFVVLYNGSPVGESLPMTADGIDSKTLTIQRKNGDGTNSNGFGESYEIDTGGLMQVNKRAGTFNGSGQDTIVVGADDKRGTVTMTFSVDSMPQVSFYCDWE